MALERIAYHEGKAREEEQAGEQAERRSRE
jgi:hypothetical protein